MTRKKKTTSKTSKEESKEVAEKTTKEKAIEALDLLSKTIEETKVLLSSEGEDISLEVSSKIVQSSAVWSVLQSLIPSEMKTSKASLEKSAKEQDLQRKLDASQKLLRNRVQIEKAGISPSQGFSGGFKVTGTLEDKDEWPADFSKFQKS